MRSAVCRNVESDLTKLISFPVKCEFDAGEDLFFVNVYNIPFDDFDRVEGLIFQYSNENREKYGTFCIPVLFTPEQSDGYEDNFLEFTLLPANWIPQDAVPVYDDDDLMYAA